MFLLVMIEFVILNKQIYQPKSNPTFDYYVPMFIVIDHLCGLVVRVSGYRYRGPGFDSRRYQIF